MACSLFNRFFGTSSNSTPTISDVRIFLAQTRCANGAPPYLANTSQPQQKASDSMFYRRHDWPVVGGQISDTVVSDDGNSYITTWSYSPWKEFVAANGDGGEVYVVEGDTVRIDHTQDGSLPYIQYFVGKNCGGTGWILFKNDAPTGSWKEITGSLYIEQDLNTCPGAKLLTGLVRYRLEDVVFPFVINGQKQNITASAIISEHYDGKTIATSKYLERFFLAAGWGRLLWEAWSTEKGAGMDLSARNPGTSFSTPPATGWNMYDCRLTTDIEPADGSLTVDAYGWK